MLRLESEIMALLDEYAADKGRSLDFYEFVELRLEIKQKTGEPCLRSGVWRPDLPVKMKLSDNNV